ncbi:sugar transporter [Legionella taurinensis]|uniref:Exopolysaccharide biosynthesis protein n=1 Tax=Legionella taurinensis TaxID=70611 RepID=A0A3A5L7R9_9GAMM|nr:exopolysaccharide biosynthesis protein [Legionella taurinensis]MDX1836199.1 exopolysaccharide biosynthesis protein [Legionella taurinensis]PUT42039.1 sugar transporter [Legionella taurinensis]PUT44826.1 sugar transporter [Legionella taurinensis]PUT48147.1 sugar transporter [Legionella taurinensis]PUT48961.1 sugar transporter [Legionella taurinensis]
MNKKELKKSRKQSISHLLKKIAMKHEKESRVCFRELVKELGDQAFGLIMILFALPSALPVSAIPGISFIFGLPILFIAIHLLIGRRILWLPRQLADRSIERGTLLDVVTKTRPYLMYVERLLKPRLTFFSTPFMERMHGVILLLLSILLLLPIPFSNFIFAMLIILFGLGIAEKDGLFLVLAYAGTVVYALALIGLTRGMIHYFTG